MKLRHLAICCLAMTLAASAFAQPRGRDTLSVGDQAPGLDVQTWVKGEETAIETGNVYVIEFWATWCPPCRDSIPHLTGLQKKYADQGLVVIGISGEEQDVVEPFVKKMGGQMDYTVAVDRRSSTNRAWMQAAGIKGIPAAFIVDQTGKIVFMGNPHPKADGEEMDRILARVMSGRYNPQLERQAKPMIQAARNQRKVRNWRMANMYYDKVIEFDDAVFAAIAIEKFEMLLMDMDDKEEAYDYARGELVNDRFADDAGALVMLAEKIASDPEIPEAKRDMDVALEAAESAHAQMGRDDPEGMAVVASIYFQRGELDKAISLQKRAYFMAKPKHKADFSRVLEAYQSAADRGGD